MPDGFPRGDWSQPPKKCVLRGDSCVQLTSLGCFSNNAAFPPGTEEPVEEMWSET